MCFKFMVISEAGFPIFEYPTDNPEGLEGLSIDSVLFSGLLSAINSCSLEATGEMIDELKFGAVQSAFSKDSYNNLYVLLSSDKIPSILLKQIHVEIKNLFINSSEQIGVRIDPGNAGLVEKTMTNKNVIESIFNPFYRVWAKKLRKFI